MLYATKAEEERRFGTRWAWVWMKMLDKTTQVSLPNLRAVSAVFEGIRRGWLRAAAALAG